MAFHFSKITIPEGWHKYMSFHTRSYTVQDFIDDNPVGTFFVGTKKHLAKVVDSELYGTFDSSDEQVTCFYRKE